MCQPRTKRVVETRAIVRFRTETDTRKLVSRRKTSLSSVGVSCRRVTRDNNAVIRGGSRDFLRRHNGREFSIPRRSTVRTLNFYCDPFSLALYSRQDIGITLTRESQQRRAINRKLSRDADSSTVYNHVDFSTIRSARDLRTKRKRSEKVAAFIADVNSSRSNMTLKK